MSSLVTGDLSQSSYDGCQVYGACVVMWCEEPFQNQEVDVEEDAEDEQGKEEEMEITGEKEVSKELSVVFSS